jgi:hypothetical protein
MDPLLTSVVNQFGLIIGLSISLFTLIQWIIRKRVETKSHIETTDANTRSQVAIREAESERDLTQALVKLAEAISRGDERDSAERQQSLMRIERMTGHIEGLAAAILSNTKGTEAMSRAISDFGGQLDEFGGRIRVIPQIQTDLHDLVVKAEGIQSGFDKTLEKHLGPLIALVIKHGADLQVVAQDGKTIISLLGHITGINERISHEEPISAEAD